jgi:hypothetical protein
MYLPYETVPTKFNDIHNYPGSLVNDTIYEKLRLTAVKTPKEMQAMGLMRLSESSPGSHVVQGLMTYFSELGYGSLPDLVDNNERFAAGNPIVPPTVYHRRLADQHTQVLRESGIEGIYPDLKQFCIDQQLAHGVANRRMIEAVRCNPLVAGYCIHALTAGDWIMGAGLLDLFRNPKKAVYKETKAANQPRLVCIRVQPRNVYAARGAKFSVAGVNELSRIKGRLSVNVTDSKGSVVHSRTTNSELGVGISTMLEEALDTSRLNGAYKVKVSFVASNGTVIAESSYPFDVFPDAALKAPSCRIALLDNSNVLRGFVKRAGVDCVEFHPELPRATPVFVARTMAANAREKKQYEDLISFIKAGGTGVYLGGGGGKRNRWGKATPTSELLPIKARQQNSQGHWKPAPKFVRDHPIFDGLPSNCLMGPIYENVVAYDTLHDLPGEPIVDTISYDTYPAMDKSLRHYYGPGDVRHGAEMIAVPYGQGRFIVSQLCLIDNLGHDPVADRILYNLMRWTTTNPAITTE